jgi:uncharacterized protein (DUF58 family)
VIASTPERVLRRVDWEVIRRLDGLLQGDYRSLLYGFGVDFADLREYQPGDDVRYIDWNVTARLGDTYIRQYVEDREITAWFLLDLSPSLEFGTVSRNKRAALIDVVATFCRLLTRHGNRVGAIVLVSGIERVIPARTGRQHVLRIINELLQEPRRRTSSLTDLGGLLRAAQRWMHRRSLIVVASDFISAPGWESQLKLLNRRHEVVAVRVSDPRELDLPDVGGLMLEDSETGLQMYVDTHDGAFRKRFREASLRRVEGVRAAFRSAGVDALWLSTEDDLVQAFVRFAALRSRRRGTPA